MAVIVIVTRHTPLQRLDQVSMASSTCVCVVCVSCAPEKGELIVQTHACWYAHPLGSKV